MESILKPMASLGLKPSLISLGSDSFLINLYDNDHYSQNDFDVIDGQTRELISKKFMQAGWRQKGSRYLESPDTRIAFSKPSHTLGSNPGDKVLEEFKRGEKFVFSTPTQSLLVMAQYAKSEKELWNDFEMLDFLSTTPVNLQMLFFWLKHDHLINDFPFQMKVMKEANDSLFHLKL